MSGGLTNYPLGDYNKLHRAVAEGCIKQILARLGLGVDDINAPSKTGGETPLIIASSHGDDRVTKLLLDRGADTERVTPSMGWTALFYSIPYPDVTRVLLKGGANHGAKNFTGSTPLHMAIRGEIGDAGLEVAEILLEFGADATAKDNRKESPLHLLAHKGRPAKGRVEAAKLLVKFRANIDAMDIKGCTPLMNTCIYVTGLVALAEILVGEGANLDAQNTFGSTPLHLLAAGDKVCGDELLGIAKLLIEKGADIGAMDSNGSTPLHIASMFIDNLMLVKLLLDRGADPNAREITGETPLHLATIAGSCSAMSVLMSAGANANLRDRRGETPLFKAASRGNRLAVSILLRFEASALLPSSGGDAIYPLEIAAALGHTDIVLELVQRVGIEGCGGPSDGGHALALAARDKRVDVMAILLKTGVVDSGVVLRLAIKAGHSKSVQVLLEWRADDILSYISSEKVADEARTTLFHCFHPQALAPSSCRTMQLLIEAGADDTSANIMINYKDGGFTMITSLVQYADYMISRGSSGSAEEEEKLAGLKGLRRLLIQKKCVTATSWLWPRGTDAAAPTTKTAAAATPALTAMMPLLRRRAVRRGFALPAMLRCVVVNISEFVVDHV